MIFILKKYLLLDNVEPESFSNVRVKEAGNILEIMHTEKLNKVCYIKKLDDKTYLDRRTGEVKYFNHIDNRSQDLNSVRQSLSRLRDYLNTNIEDVSFCRWVTLTYAENMTDTKRLYKDFKCFIKRLKYYLGASFEYIVAMEPQGRGAWHAHLVLIFDSKAPYIPNETLRDIWGFGFVTVKKLDNVDNVGAYLTAYLGDMELLDAEKEGVDIKGLSIKNIALEGENGQTVTKSIVKGARLSMYPPKFNLYRISRGIKKPVISNETYLQAKQKASGATLTFQKTIFLVDADKEFQNTISYRYYNRSNIKNK